MQDGGDEKDEQIWREGGCQAQDGKDESDDDDDEAAGPRFLNARIGVGD